MSKSVYSLLLDDRLVQLIDAEAAKRRVSRSVCVEQLLSAQLGHVTPSQKAGMILDDMSAALSDNLHYAGATSRNTARVLGVAPYRYRPTVLYSVDVQGEGDVLGTVRVNFRGKEEGLIRMMNAFFDNLPAIENSVFGNSGEYDGGTYRRVLMRNGSETNEGQRLANYLDFLHDALCVFFKNNY